MAKKAQEARSYPVPMDFFVQKLRMIDQAGLNVNLKSENPTPTGVWFRILHGFSMASYGEKITVTLENLGGGTGVHILSECGMPTQVVDWGKNASNVRAIFAYLEQGLPMGQPMNAPQAAYAAQQPAYDPRGGYASQQPAQPTYAQQPVQPAYAAQQPVPQANRFCPGCGAPAAPGANFCGHCGARLG